MPKKPHKDRYLEEHQRNICPDCQRWEFWYRDKKGNKVFGCVLGLIPHRDECPCNSKRGQKEVTPTVIGEFKHGPERIRDQQVR